MRLLLVSFMMLAFMWALPQSEVVAAEKAEITIYYFHGERRCPTCKKVEANAKAALDKYYSKEVKSGKIVFKSINFEENEKLAKKYGADSSMLIIVKDNAGKEELVDLTSFAFMNAANKDKYIEKIKTEIDNLRK
jgi:hypothetical protein